MTAASRAFDLWYLQPMRHESALGWMAAVAACGGLASACSDDAASSGCARKVVTSDQSCTVSADCEAAALALTCVDGTCRLPCRLDADCDLVAQADPNEDPACRATAENTPAAVCQAGICEVGCPDVACGTGETCYGGRCVYYGEGFEPPGDQTFVDLQLLGFNEPPGELQNTNTRIYPSGAPGCTPAVDFNCFGPAAEGAFFVVLESVPTPPKGSPETGTTCRACACCLECLAAPPPAMVSINNCPATPDIPTPLSCPARHPSCDAVCSACDQCPAADRPGVRDNPLLLDCEETAAGKRCALCDACDAFLEVCQSQQCPVCNDNPTSEACRVCVDESCLDDQRCLDCLTCADAQRCARTDPGSAECNRLNDACDAQGASGCFDVPVDYLRAELRDDEQALRSPVIDLSASTGEVVMQFDYVSFDVGVSYFPGRQGQPPETWRERPQNVRVQFCASGCGMTGWSDAVQVDGEPALLPPDGERNNGRLLGDQTTVDWRAGRVTLAVPPQMRTATFQYRLLPNLDEGVRFGVDNILIRSEQ